MKIIFLFMYLGFERHHVTSSGALITQENNGACLLELERITKQIESVKCEVEKQQRKLSYYKTRKNDQSGLCSSVNKSKNKIAENDPSANKYVLEKSRPLTDLEYDPCSNFSSGLLSGTASDCSVRPCKEQETTLEQNQSDQKIKVSHHSDDSDDGTLVIDVPCLEEDPQGVEQVVQTKTTKPEPTESPPKDIQEAKRCRDLFTDCVLSTQKHLPRNERCEEELFKSPSKCSEGPKTGNGTALKCFEKDGEIVSLASFDHVAPLLVPDAGLSATGVGTGVDHSTSSSHHEDREKKLNISNVLDDLSACLEDLKNQSETTGCRNETEPIQMENNGNGLDGSNQKEDMDFCSLHQELHQEIASLEKALGEPNKNDQRSLLSIAPQNHVQHVVEPEELHLSTQTTSFYPLTKDTGSGQNVEGFTEGYWPSVQNIQNEMYAAKLPTYSSMTDQGLPWGQSNAQPLRYQDALMKATNPNQFLMLQKPMTEYSVGLDVHQAPGVLHTPVPTTVPRGMEKEDIIEIDSSSEEELNYSDLDLSESDPMEECYKIFMESNDGGDSEFQDPSPVSCMTFLWLVVEREVKKTNR